MRKIKKLLGILVSVSLAAFLFSAACPVSVYAADESTETVEEKGEEEAKDLMILYTSDVHCGIDQGFGYVGLAEVKKNLEEKGYNVLLVDDGDSIQGEAIGTMTRGEAMIRLMNVAGYDVVIPGNHEFDYGMERFFELVEMADFPYISCNFNLEGELVFDPYVIKDVDGIKVGFVGVTTPYTLTTSTPKYFQNEDGEYIYGFLEGDDGTDVYEAVQKAVDDARSEGADYIVVLAHLGDEEKYRPYTYADIIANTTGIDVLLDGHSHDTNQVVMKNADGEDVYRSACGTKLNGIGHVEIKQDGSINVGLWPWNADATPADLFGIENKMTEAIALATDELNEKLEEVVATTSVPLTIYDPEEVDNAGAPIRMVRRAETNLGNLCADAYFDQSGADIALVNGGGIRTSIDKGDITLNEILKVYPFGNMMTVVEASGQQILDALEWSSRAVPGELGVFMQPAGLSYEIHTYIEDPCTSDSEGMFTGIEGERRVKNVMVGEEPIDPEEMYTVASTDYVLLNHGDGITMFDGCKVLQNAVKLDNQVLIDYITGTLKGKIDTGYEDLTGQGRIVIVDEPADDYVPEEVADTGEPAGDENTGIASTDHYETPEAAVDAFLSAIQGFEEEKITAYCEEEGIGNEDGGISSMFEAMEESFGTELPEESRDDVKKIISKAFDFDYEIGAVEETEEGSLVDVTFKTYDFSSVLGDLMSNFIGEAMGVLLINPDAVESDIIAPMITSMAKAFDGLEEKTEESTVPILCYEKDGKWYIQDPEELFTGMTGNFLTMFDEFGF